MKPIHSCSSYNCNLFQAIFIFKFKKKLLPANFNDYFRSVKNIYNYNTRFSETFFSYLDLTTRVVKNRLPIKVVNYGLNKHYV